MNLFNIFIFFFNHVEKKIWIYVAINYFIILLITFSDIIFFSIFYLLLNKQIDYQLLNVILDNLKIFYNFFYLDLDTNRIYIILLLFFLIFKNILSYFQNYFYYNFIYNLTLDKSAKLLNVYFNLDFETFNKKELSIYIKQVVRDIETTFLGNFGLAISVVGEIIYVLILIFFLNFLINLNINFGIVILFILLLYILYYLFKKSDKLGKLRAYNEIKVFKTLSDLLSLFRELKLNNQFKSFIERYKFFLKNYYNSKIYSGLINISPKFILEMFSILFFLFLYGASELNINDFFLKFSVLAVAMLRLIPSFSKITSYVSNILYNYRSIEFIKNDLNRVTKIDKKLKLHKSINNIKLKNISLSYYSNNNSNNFKILNNFNLFLNRNNIYGIYGPSGSGKTSLLNILIGFIKPQKGKIYYNNKKQNFNQITKNFNISFLSQNPTILDENLLINSTLKFSNTSEEINKIKFYLKKFNLNRFLHSKFAENFSIKSIKNMSGGEKQRIAFIRSLINEPDLLILDEPVSSLDKENSEIIFKFLRKYKNNRIIIVTSHKESEIKYFDKILHLKNY